MSIYVCDISAAQFWTSGAFNPADFPYLCARSIEHASTHKKEILRFNSICESKGALFNTPIHSYVSMNQGRMSTPYLAPHTCSKLLPLNTFIEFLPEVYIASPEHCFFQLSSKLSFIQLIKLGFELCATYREGAPYDKKLIHAAPLTSVEKTKDYLSEWHNNAGLAKAKRALEYVLPNSDSPMETKMAMLLTLPNALGGGAIGQAQLNTTINLGAEAQKICGKSFLKPDLLLEKEMIAIEYDSDTHHTGSNRIASDSSRRTALQHEGYSVLTVTRQEINSLESVDAIISTIYRLAEKRRRIVIDNYEERRAQLYRNIKPSHMLWDRSAIDGINRVAC